MAAYDELEASFERVAALSLDAMTDPEQVALMNRREVLARRLPSVDHPVINRLVAEASPTELGGTQPGRGVVDRAADLQEGSPPAYPPRRTAGAAHRHHR